MFMETRPSRALNRVATILGYKRDFVPIAASDALQLNPVACFSPHRFPANIIDVKMSHVVVMFMSLTKAQALEMYRSDDLIGIGMEADAVRRKLHPEGVVTYIIDRNINY